MSWNVNYNKKKTIETQAGIKAKSKRGAFVKNWWATRWLTAMEQLMNRGRLQRGRRYARKGQVISLTVSSGKIDGMVQGSRKRPYKVTLQINALTDDEWERVIQSLVERPIFMAQLLAGEMPQEIESMFSEADVSLFPAMEGELVQDCNCPDWADVCKHLAAVHYILAERFDEDPFLLFQLRGKSQAEISDILNKHQNVADVETITEPVYTPAAPLAEALEDFWEVGDLTHFRTDISLPPTLYPVFVRLGIPAFLENAERWLTPAYDSISKKAVDITFIDEVDEQGAENENEI